MFCSPVCKKKSGENQSISPKNSNVHLTKKYSSDNNCTDSARSGYVFSYEFVRFFKSLVYHELYVKMYEKITKVRLYEKRYNFETKQNFE